MGLEIARFFSLLFVALVLAPALVYLLELPNKIGLSREEYLVVQQIYNGWQLPGIVIYGALLSTLVLTIMIHRQPKVFGLTLAAFLCLLAAHGLFWIYTFPANQETLYWTVLPENWMALRAQWEYSHAAGAVLNLTAFILLLL
ncbi:MAG TPA: hypothetical protein VLG93_00830 [Sulfuricaulis sp.]|nr:hypothetical protein [Sulfuricaulis sp.]